MARAFPAVRRRYGWRRSLALALHEVAFDPRHGTDTSVEPGLRRTPSANPTAEHEACNPLIFAELIAHAVVDPASGAFLDLGAGKGRALLLAAGCGFRSVIGVESSPRLCAAAQRNIGIAAARRPGVRLALHCADAASFAIPADVAVVFLFNPFGPDGVAAVVDRLTASLRDAPRDLSVVYVHPRCADLFLRAGFTSVYRQGSDGLVLRTAGSAARRASPEA